MSLNRQQRRAQEKKNRSKKVPSYKKMTKEQRKEALVKNGITIADLEKEYEVGFEAGFNAASPSVIKTIYAAVALAANDLHGFGKKRTKELLKAIDDYVVDTLTSEEIINDVWKRIGLRLDFDDPIDLVKED